MLIGNQYFPPPGFYENDPVLSFLFMATPRSLISCMIKRKNGVVSKMYNHVLKLCFEA